MILLKKYNCLINLIENILLSKIFFYSNSNRFWLHLSESLQTKQNKNRCKNQNDLFNERLAIVQKPCKAKGQCCRILVLPSNQSRDSTFYRGNVVGLDLQNLHKFLFKTAIKVSRNLISTNNRIKYTQQNGIIQLIQVSD